MKQLVKKLKREKEPLLVQEKPGFHLSIAADTRSAGEQAAKVAFDRYEDWLSLHQNNLPNGEQPQFFTIAVGGGNTVKSAYRALLDEHAFSIDWIEHVRFFFLERRCNDGKRESVREGLETAFLEPLAHKLINKRGRTRIIKKLALDQWVTQRDLIQRIIEHMIVPIHLAEVRKSLKNNDSGGALQLARKEARRYQRVIKEHLGPEMAFNLIISGIGRDGGLGAFTPYMNELKKKQPGVIAMEKPNGAIVIALNRGLLTRAKCISLLVSGNNKLKALGRFEMDETGDFESTVQETPIRMLRESREIAEKVYLFASDKALYFKEGLFTYKKDGHTVDVRSEVRDGDEENGIHALLVHGWMGLYTYVNLLLRLPSAWQVSALRRGKYAMHLKENEIFPHYADALRRIILSNWRSGRPTPVCFHSMGGVISAHLLLSMLKDYDDDLPEFDNLRVEDKKLIEALRAAGLIHIATWAPSDLHHLVHTKKMMVAHRKKGEPVDFTGPETVYEQLADGSLKLNKQHLGKADLGIQGKITSVIKIPGMKNVITTINGLMRRALDTLDMSKLLNQDDTPYGARLLAVRVLKKVSIYGVLKELDAASHDPVAYQDRHLKALEAVIKYDIPYLSIIHEDDSMVSAVRHKQEYEYLLAARMKKEGVNSAKSLSVPVNFQLLKRDGDEVLPDALNPHFLILSTEHEGKDNTRRVTTAITRFVNQNVAHATERREVEPLESITSWSKVNQPPARKAG